MGAYDPKDPKNIMMEASSCLLSDCNKYRHLLTMVEEVLEKNTSLTEDDRRTLSNLEEQLSRVKKFLLDESGVTIEEERLMRYKKPKLVSTKA